MAFVDLYHYWNCQPHMDRRPQLIRPSATGWCTLRCGRVDPEDGQAVCRNSRRVMKSILTGRLNAAFANQTLDQIAEINEQFDQVQLGAYMFHEDYLKEV